MNFLSRISAAILRFDRAWLSPGPAVVLPPAVTQTFKASPLVVADVGSAGGLDARWEKIKDFAHFLTFEPRPETPVPHSGITNFPVCLGAETGERTLYVTKFPQSSSLYRIDDEKMSDFAVHRCFDVTQTLAVAVDTLDNCLGSKKGFVPSFLKVDVEGADLDVLRGAAELLRSSILALRVEVSFMARHHAAPVFADIDSFLSARGFLLFSLTRELMLRRNIFYTAVSQPQLVWGDAVYFLGRRPFLERVAGLNPAQRLEAVAHYLVILLTHGAHDYAKELLDAIGEANLVSQKDLEPFQMGLEASVKKSRWYIFKAMGGALLSLGIYLVSFPFPRTRELATFYLKRRWGYLFHFLVRLTGRGGALNATISDVMP